MADGMIDDYLQQQLTRDLRTPQEFQFEHLTPATRMLQKRKELDEVQAALNTEKKEYGQRIEKVADMETNLAKKKENLLKLRHQLDRNILSHHEAYEESCRKIERCNDDVKLLDEEIKRKKKEFKEKTKELKKLQKTAEKLAMYPAFLKKLSSEEQQDFDNEQEITKRYDTLDSTQMALISRTKKWTADHSESRTELATGMAALQQKKLECWTDMGLKTTELDQRTKRAKTVEDEFNDITKRSTDENRILGQISLAVANLYETIIRRQTRDSKKQQQQRNLRPMEQLETIERYFRDYVKIYDELSRARDAREGK